MSEVRTPQPFPVRSTVWSDLTGALTNDQLVPYTDAGISYLSAASLAIGNGTAGDMSGSISLKNTYSSGGTPTSWSGTWFGGCVPSASNYGIIGTAVDTYVNCPAVGGVLALKYMDVAMVTITQAEVGISPTIPINWGWDAGISRLNSGVLAIGNGKQGDASGSLVMANVTVTGLPVYANNAAAVAGGLAVGSFYRTGADPDPVCVVH